MSRLDDLRRAASARWPNQLYEMAVRDDHPYNPKIIGWRLFVSAPSLQEAYEKLLNVDDGDDGA